MPMFQTDGDWTDLEELIRDKLGEEAVEDPDAVVKKDKGRYTYDVRKFFGFFDPSQVFQSQTILQTIRSLKKSQKMSSLKNPKMERSFERSFYRENIV